MINTFKLLALILLTTLAVVYTNCGKILGEQSELVFRANVYGGSAEGSYEAFALTVYPITRAQCITCHQTTSPVHASADVKKAHDSLISTFKVNFENISASRLVAKLRDDHHNCWSDCASNAAEIEAAIEQWNDMIVKEAPLEPLTTITTDSSRTMEQEFNDTANPQKSNTVRLDIGAAMLKSPMVKTNDSAVGAFLSVPTNTNNSLTATDVNAGAAYFSFDIRVAGNYKVWMLVSAPTANDNGLYVKFDNLTPVTFDPVVNAQNYDWRMVPNLSQNLSVGRHTLELREKKDGTKVSSIIITADNAFKGIDVGSFVGVTLSYNLAGLLGNLPVSMKIDVADYDSYTYKFSNPRIISSQKNIKIKNVKLLVNGAYNPQHSTYTVVDKVIMPSDPIVSPYAMIVLKDQGFKFDKISFSFETLMVMGTNTTGGTGSTGSGTVGTASGATSGGGTGLTSLESFTANVYPISRNNCISCHAVNQFPQHSSANVQLAHDLFVNEPLADFINIANSRIITKLRNQRHNCGTPANCDAIANQYMTAITEWKKSRP